MEYFYINVLETEPAMFKINNQTHLCAIFLKCTTGFERLKSKYK